MHPWWKLCSLSLGILAVLSGSAAAADLGPTKIFLSLSDQTPVASLFAFGNGTMVAGKPPGFDYALFATELAAYITKEVLSDAAEEYRGSPIGSRLSQDMPEQRSEFGSHCLTVVTQLGSALPSLPRSIAPEGSPTMADYAVRTGTALLVVRQVWSALRNDIENNRTGFSLNPKVSARRVGVNLTLHW